MQGSGQKQQPDAGSEIRYWLWVNTIPGIGNKTRHRLLETFGSPRKVYDAEDTELLKYQKTLGKKRIEAILHTKSLDTAERILEACQKADIHILTYNQSFFPDSLKKIEELPVLLYYKGSSRIDGIPVISGMAKGIDSYAHTACIQKGGFPIAVLGNGLDICYPSEHQTLMKAIEETGLLLSEYAPGRQPQAYQFPQRNRIIAALSEEVIVIGAGARSGARITAGFAEAYGKVVRIE